MRVSSHICWFVVVRSFDPFEDRYNDMIAGVCQGQIFFSLLCSVALKYDPGTQSDASNLDILLVVLWALPVLLSIILLTPAPGIMEDRMEVIEQRVGGRIDHLLMRSKQWSTGRLSLDTIPASKAQVELKQIGIEENSATVREN
jgi:hypothetical protein